MGEVTAIEWADHTFNPWIGCQKVSPACDHCYAESWANRYGKVEWGPHGERKRTSEANWREPLKWDRAAERVGERRRVFCASLADVFDNQVPPAWRRDLFDLIRRTPYLEWMLLTKRPENIVTMVLAADGLPRNFALGTTIEDQKRADHCVPHLLRAKAALRPLYAFLSCEPLLGPLTLDLTGIDWVIVGGESGHGARPMLASWARSLRDQCAAAGVPFFFKQWGEHTPDDPAATHTAMRRVGKKAAGRVLDGRTFDQLPVPS